MNETYLFFSNWLSDYAEMTDEEFGALIRCAMSRMAGKDVTLPDRMMNMVANNLVSQLQAVQNKRGAISVKRKAAGNASASTRVRKAKPTEEPQPQPAPQQQPAPQPQPQPAPQPQSQSTLDGQLWEELRKNEMWKQEACVQLGLSSTAELDAYIVALKGECACTDKTHASMKDLKAHVMNYVRVQKRISGEKSTVTTRIDAVKKENERRQEMNEWEQRANERAANSITREEYEELKARAAKGDKAAMKALAPPG